MKDLHRFLDIGGARKHDGLGMTISDASDRFIAVSA
jgi:hypothetical protein